jgi:hypothetical protein
MWLGHARVTYRAITCIKCRYFNNIMQIVNMDNIMADAHYFSGTIYNTFGKLHTEYFYEIEN